MLVEPVQLFKCLSDETRLAATLLLRQEGELCVCELMAALGQSQPKISRHLSQLRHSNVLTDKRRGQWVYYAISPDLPRWILTILDSTAQAHRALLLQLTDNLTRMDDRPEPCNN